MTRRRRTPSSSRSTPRAAHDRRRADRGRGLGRDLKAKFQALRDKSGKKAVLLASESPSPSASAHVWRRPTPRPGRHPDQASDLAAKPKPEKPEPKPAATGPAVSFMKESRRSSSRTASPATTRRRPKSKYVMTTFARLKKGGARGEGITLAPGDPDESYLVELIRPDGEPRMPFKQEPLPPEKIALIERWVKRGGEVRRPGDRRGLGRAPPQVDPRGHPRSLPRARADHGPGVHAQGGRGRSPRAITRSTSGSSPTAPSPAASGRCPSGSMTSPTAPTASGSPPRAGDPGQFGSATLWKVEADGKLTLVRDLVESTDCLFAVAFSPDGKTLAAAGADRAIRLWEVGTWQGAGDDRGPRRLDPRPGLQPRRQAARQRLARQDEQGVRRRQEGGPRHLPRPRRGGLRRRLHAPTASTSPAAAPTARSASGTPTTTASSLAQTSAASAARSSGSSSSPTARRWSPARPTRRVRVFEELRAPKQTLDGPQRLGLHLRRRAPTARRSPPGAGTARSALWNLADGKPLRTFVAAPGLKPKDADRVEVSRGGGWDSPSTTDRHASLRTTRPPRSGGAADEASEGRTWLSCEPPRFYDDRDLGRIWGGSKPNFTPDPADAASAAKMGLPDGDLHSLVDVLSLVSRRTGSTGSSATMRWTGRSGRSATASPTRICSGRSTPWSAWPKPSARSTSSATNSREGSWAAPGSEGLKFALRLADSAKAGRPTRIIVKSSRGRADPKGLLMKGLAAPLLVAALTVAASSVHAQGIFQPGAGPINISMAGASTAAPIDIGASYWNPATISGLDRTGVHAGLGVDPLPSIHLDHGRWPPTRSRHLPADGPLRPGPEQQRRGGRSPVRVPARGRLTRSTYRPRPLRPSTAAA